ncbi:MAG: response regulator transcription factor [Lachnospiraceae bacterium]|nr:response regulator transcription factor [Lachnospiraceae bacterium]
MKNLRVMLVDDEPLLLESLEIILAFHQITVTGKAHDGQEALSLLKEEMCDIAMVDLNMKGMGGIELISRMKAEYPQIKILVLTTFYDDKHITQAIAGGADGYLLKDSGKDAILGAVGQIMGGRNVIDGKVMKRLAMLMGGTSRDAGLLEGMTEREKEICTLLAQGNTNKQIAGLLYISEGTVKNYISSIYEKTGVHDRAKLVALMNG